MKFMHYFYRFNWTLCLLPSLGLWHIHLKSAFLFMGKCSDSNGIKTQNYATTLITTVLLLECTSHCRHYNEGERYIKLWIFYIRVSILKIYRFKHNETYRAMMFWGSKGPVWGGILGEGQLAGPLLTSWGGGQRECCRLPEQGLGLNRGYKIVSCLLEPKKLTLLPMILAVHRSLKLHESWCPNIVRGLDSWHLWIQHWPSSNQTQSASSQSPKTALIRNVLRLYYQTTWNITLCITCV